MGKKSKAPAAPDYTALAKQTADSQNAQLAAQTAANRPNQTGPSGSINWTQDATGNWTQNTTLNPAEQQQLDANRQIRSGLLGQAASALDKPMTTAGLPAWKSYDTSQLANVDPASAANGLPAMGTLDADPNFGGVKEVQDAMLSRLNPMVQDSRNAEIQRLKSQGIPENSAAFQRALRTKDQQQTDVNQQALLGANQAYGDIFNRNLAKANFDSSNNAQQFGQNTQIQSMLAALRGQQFGEQGAEAALSGNQRSAMLTEQQNLRNSPLTSIAALDGTNPNMPAYQQFTNASQGQGTDLLGAGTAQYKAALDQYNANQARGSSLTSGLFGLAGTVGGAALGNPTLGGMIGKGLFGG